MELTQKQREKISPYENHLHTAAFADYVVGLPRKAINDLVEVYNEVYKAHERPTSCPACVLKICNKLGRLYYGTNKQK